jgi:hypothetical protein
MQGAAAMRRRCTEDDEDLMRTSSLTRIKDLWLHRPQMPA